MKTKTMFFCTDCGAESAKWLGRCPVCGAWNTMEEVSQKDQTAKSGRRAAALSSKPQLLSELTGGDELRFSAGIGELDRVLGGGAVRGSVILVGGAPGIGKSTLLLQICGLMPDERILYVTGEESRRQLKLRADRLGVDSTGLYVLAETDLSAITDAVEKLSPGVLICDSIQTMYDAELSSAPGSVGQVKSSTLAITTMAREKGLTAFIVSHVNKEGAIAGPKVLEHMVDCVLYFEGERGGASRILRAAKNRFGSTNEIGVFEMTGAGLAEVENPSEMLLSGRPENSPGTCVACVMEGSRPILAEIQALVTSTASNNARRNSTGIEINRALLLLAVLDKRGGVPVSACDAYINVVGGLELDETAADLATVLAIASSYRDTVIPGNVCAIGEVGLTGEIRSVTALTQRLAEAGRLGFTECFVPAHAMRDAAAPKGLSLIPVRNVREAIAAIG